MHKITLVSANESNYFQNNRIEKGTSIPETGNYTKGDIIVNTGDDSNINPMWVCSESGTPGTWVTITVGSIHPDTHPASMIVEDSEHNFVTEAEKNKINDIGDVTLLQTENKSDLVNALNEVNTTVTSLKLNVSNGKSLIATAITGKGVDASSNDNFTTLANKIDNIDVRQYFPKWYGNILLEKLTPSLLYKPSYPTGSVVGTKMYIFGGQDSPTAYKNTNCYDSVANTIEAKADMPTARAGACAATIGTNIHVLGGTTDVGYGTTYAVNEVYDTLTDTWSTKQPMPTARESFLSCAYGKTIHCIGGYITSSKSVTDVNEVYDSLTNTWSTKRPMTTARGFLNGDIHEDNIYCIGGHSTNYLGLHSEISILIEVYNITSDSWSTKSVSPVRVARFSANTIDDKIYCTSCLGQDNLLMYYNIPTDEWIKLTFVPGYAGRISCVIGHMLFHFGGFSASVPGSPYSTSSVYII